MMDQIQETNPAAYLTEPRFPPVAGAILMALQDFGIVINEEIFRNLDASRPKIGLKNVGI
jgi:hypothetical protein